MVLMAEIIGVTYPILRMIASLKRKNVFYQASNNMENKSYICLFSILRKAGKHRKSKEILEEC